jgi:hypothetical protein
MELEEKFPLMMERLQQAMKIAQGEMLVDLQEMKAQAAAATKRRKPWKTPVQTGC